MTEQQPEAQSSNMAQAEPTSYGKPPLRVSYKVPFSLRLRYTITSIARFFRIMKQPEQNYAEIPEFLPIKNGERVGSYCTSLRMLYIDPETSHLSLDHWQLVDIKTYKDKGSKYKHEYLIATLSDGAMGRVLLRIDRRIQASSIKKIGKAIIASGLSQSQPIPPNHTDSGKQDTTQPIEPEQKPFKKTAMDDVTLVKPNVPYRKRQNLVEHIMFETQYAFHFQSSLCWLPPSTLMPLIMTFSKRIATGFAILLWSYLRSSRHPLIRHSEQGVGKAPG